SRTEIVATPLTRPPGSESTTSPSTCDPRGATTCPSTTIGSARVAVNASPVLVVFVDSVVSVRTLIGVPAPTVTEDSLGESGASAFAGVASEEGVKPVTVDCSELLLHPASSTAKANAVPVVLNR